MAIDQPPSQMRVSNELAKQGMAISPLEGWRNVKVADWRTAADDYAHVLKDLADVHFAKAETIVLVRDNLNTHASASLYEAFPAAEVRRLVERFEWQYTPKHGSWPDLAESELGVLALQCLYRRCDNILARRSILNSRRFYHPVPIALEDERLLCGSPRSGMTPGGVDSRSRFKLNESPGAECPMSQSASNEDAVADQSSTPTVQSLLDRLRSTYTTSSSAGLEEGMRLIREFLSIKNSERRQAAVNFVADLARVDASDLR